MTAARIFRPAKTAMQSGQGGSREWVLEYEPESARGIDPLMGWTSSADSLSQVRLTFDSQDEAVAYARKNGIAYRVLVETPRKHIPKSYADNFRYGRRKPWTH